MPSGNNQHAAIAINDIVSIPQDTKFLLDSISAISTDGSTSTVTVTIANHGLLTGNLITTYTEVAVGGIAAADLSVVGASVTVSDVNTFTYTANDVSSSVDTGFLDQVISTSVRYYTVGTGELEVYDNGVKQTLGVNYSEVGTAYSSSNQIQWLKNIPVSTPTARLEYRIDANGGQFIVNQIGESSTRNLSQMTNNSGGLISKAGPVAINSSGEIIPVDIGATTSLSTVGLAYENIADAATGSVISNGRIENATLTASLGDVLYVTPTGTLIGSSEFSSGTAPSIGVDGFAASDEVIRVGVVVVNQDNPSNKDIIVNIQFLGQL